MSYSLIKKISPLSKYGALYLEVRIYQIWFQLSFCFIVLKGLAYKILSLYIHWRPHNQRSYFVFPPFCSLWAKFLNLETYFILFIVNMQRKAKHRGNQPPAQPTLWRTPPLSPKPPRQPHSCFYIFHPTLPLHKRYLYHSVRTCS